MEKVDFEPRPEEREQPIITQGESWHERRELKIRSKSNGNKTREPSRSIVFDLQGTGCRGWSSQSVSEQTPTKPVGLHGCTRGKGLPRIRSEDPLRRKQWTDGAQREPPEGEGQNLKPSSLCTPGEHTGCYRGSNGHRGGGGSCWWQLCEQTVGHPPCPQEPQES